MIDINEMEMRIAVELEESGQENIAAMVNTIIAPTGDAGEIAMMRDALDHMVRGGLVTMALDPGPGKKLVRLEVDDSLALVDRIEALLRFRASDRHWTFATDERPNIIATESKFSTSAATNGGGRRNSGGVSLEAPNRFRSRPRRREPALIWSAFHLVCNGEC